jgi:hypothetical protein
LRGVGKPENSRGRPVPGLHQALGRRLEVISIADRDNIGQFLNCFVQSGSIPLWPKEFTVLKTVADDDGDMSKRMDRDFMLSAVAVTLQYPERSLKLVMRTVSEPSVALSGTIWRKSRR